MSDTESRWLQLSERDTSVFDPADWRLRASHASAYVVCSVWCSGCSVRAQLGPLALTLAVCSCLRVMPGKNRVIRATVAGTSLYKGYTVPYAVAGWLDMDFWGAAGHV